MKTIQKNEQKSFIEKVCDYVVALGVKWPPDCGGLIYQPKRPEIKPDITPNYDK